jgi:hypothetical protein
MVTVTLCTTRPEIAEAMSHLRAEAAALTRRGHEGKHQSCDDCERYATLHANLNLLITSWQLATP